MGSYLAQKVPKDNIKITLKRLYWNELKATCITLLLLPTLDILITSHEMAIISVTLDC